MGINISSFLYQSHKHSLSVTWGVWKEATELPCWEFLTCHLFLADVLCPGCWAGRSPPGWVCAEAALAAGRAVPVCWVSVPYGQQLWWACRSWSGRKPQHTHWAADVLLYRPATLLSCHLHAPVVLVLVISTCGDWALPVQNHHNDTHWRNWRKLFFLCLQWH